MRKTAVASVVMSCTVLATVVHAGPQSFTVLSGWQRISGGAMATYRYTLPDPDHPGDSDWWIDVEELVEESYDSGVVPWDGSAISAGVVVKKPEYAWWSFQPGNNPYASSRANALCVQVSAFSGGGFGEGWANAAAGGSWLLQPYRPTLRLLVADAPFLHLPSATLTITDQTADGEILYHYQGDPYFMFGWSYPESWGTHDFLVIPGHEYLINLELGVSSQGGEGRRGGVIRLTVIPVPGALLLGTLGTGLFAWLRRRRTL